MQRRWLFVSLYVQLKESFEIIYTVFVGKLLCAFQGFADGGGLLLGADPCVTWSVPQSPPIYCHGFDSVPITTDMALWFF